MDAGNPGFLQQSPRKNRNRGQIGLTEGLSFWSVADCLFKPATFIHDTIAQTLKQPPLKKHSTLKVFKDYGFVK